MLVIRRKVGKISFPISLAVYLISNITGIMITQLNLGDVNLVFSIFYIVFALGIIIYGFKQKMVVTRRFGLGLAFFALGKPPFVITEVHIESPFKS